MGDLCSEVLLHITCIIMIITLTYMYVAIISTFSGTDSWMSTLMHELHWCKYNLYVSSSHPSCTITPSSSRLILVHAIRISDHYILTTCLLVMLISWISYQTSIRKFFSWRHKLFSGFILHVRQSQKLRFFCRRRRIGCDSNPAFSVEEKYLMQIAYRASASAALTIEAAGIIGLLVYISALCSLSSMQ